MKVTTLRDGKITLVVLTGRLDTTGVNEISESFSAAVGAARQSAIIDLSQIEFVGSNGLGLLLSNRKQLAQVGQQLVLLNPTEIVESVLKATRLDQVMPVAYDLDEAINQLGIGPDEHATAADTAVPDQQAERPQSEVMPSAAAVADGPLKLSIKNELAELPGLNAALAEFLRQHGVPERAVYAVSLAIDELVVNVIRYAYVDDDTHLIDLELAVEGEQVVLRIADDGRPFDPRKGPELDPHSEAGQVAALGLLLVLEMVDMLKYRRVEDHNRVEVRIHFFPADADNTAASTPGGHVDAP